MSSPAGYCNASQFDAISTVLGPYAYVAPVVCSQADVSNQTATEAVIQWTVGTLLATQSNITNATNSFTSTTAELMYGLDVAFILLEAFGVFCMQTGFALFAAGVVRAKSVSSILLKSFIDTGISAICFYLVGYAFAFGARDPTNGFIGNWDFALSQTASGPPPNTFQLFFWNWVFCAASTTILSGAVAERATLLSYCLYAAFYSSWVYPVVAHWNWSPHGWLSPEHSDPLLGVGSIDFAGSGVVHTIGGVSAVVAAVFLGPRVGRFDATSQLKDFKFGHNPPLYMLGTFLLWFGWYGFNPGSNLAIATYAQATVVSRTAVTTSLAAAAGSLCALVAVYWRTRTWDMLATCSGSLAGLVAITAGCSVVEPWAAILCGGVAGVTVMWGDELLEHFQVDDPACAFVIHGLSGIWGVLFVGFLGKGDYINQVYYTTPSSARQGLFYGGHGQLLLCQVISVVVIIAWATVWMSLFFGLINWLGILRVPLSDEAIGLDVAVMNEGRRPSTMFVKPDFSKVATFARSEFSRAMSNRFGDVLSRSQRGGNQHGGNQQGGSPHGGSQHGGSQLGDSNHGANNFGPSGSGGAVPGAGRLTTAPSKEMPLLQRTSTSSLPADNSRHGSPGPSLHNGRGLAGSAPSPLALAATLGGSPSSQELLPKGPGSHSEGTREGTQPAPLVAAVPAGRTPVP